VRVLEGHPPDAGRIRAVARRRKKMRAGT
jgi:hypothetical protein